MRYTWLVLLLFVHIVFSEEAFYCMEDSCEKSSLFDTAPRVDTPPKFIPRTTLFGNPTRANPQLSPDGKFYAYLASSEVGLLNVWVGKLDEKAETISEKMVTNDTVRGIRVFQWIEKEGHLVYMQDKGGDENFHAYLVNVDTLEIRDLTPYEGKKVQDIVTSKQHPNELLLALNLRNDQVFDMHRYDLETGALTLAAENPGTIVMWLTDLSFHIRAALRTNPQDGSSDIIVRDSEDEAWRMLLHFPDGDEGSPLAFHANGKDLYLLSTLDSDTNRLLLVDTEDAHIVEVVAHNETSDISEVILQPDDNHIQAVAFDYLYREWKVIDAEVEEDFKLIAALPGRKSSFSVKSRTKDDDRWIVTFSFDNASPAWYVYERKEKRGWFLNRAWPELSEYALTPVYPEVIEARDGVKVPIYVSLPLYRASNQPLPMVVIPHGGPWHRDTWGYNSFLQWVTNRGYVCLLVNFRGSTGFGKKYLHLGDKQWGVGTMQHDITDAVQWAISEGIADKERIAILGGSYGGYATLAGLAFTPDLYRCGVDIVGPSNIKTLLDSIPPYWEPLKKLMQNRIGDADTDEVLNRRISPLFHADKIKAPLLIAQGANDPRVKKHEADQMFNVMKEKGLEVEYVLYPDEGHGFSRPPNRFDFILRAEVFLAKHIGDGTVDNSDEVVEGSSAVLITEKVDLEAHE